VIQASWSSAQALWTVEVERTDTGERKTMLAKWLFSAAGYFHHDEGFTPKLEGIERFQGRTVHPQHWPEDLDYTGKRVVVIGSGATAVTLLPAMADKAKHVTMLQRTPTYVVSLPSGRHHRQHATQGDTARVGLRARAPQEHRHFARHLVPVQEAAKICAASHPLPQQAPVAEGYPIDVHFNPPYDPWDQRLCAVPDGDLFKAIRQARRLW
jgi:cation diffusion facilitator CzcD-associated flavoprotein CzcO